MIKTAFFVSEDEYPKLQEACPLDFPYTYKQFVQRVEDAEREIPDIIRMNVITSEFLAWCDESEVDSNGSSRSQYAAFLYAQSINPDAHL